MSRNARHELEVTSDRLGDHYQKFYEKFSSPELSAISSLRNAFEEIAEGARGDVRVRKNGR